MEESSQDTIQPVLAITPQGVEAFLSGKMVEGIGPIYARRLVADYGVDVVRRLRDEPQSITGIPGLGEARIATASQSLATVKHPLDLLVFLYSCGIKDLFVDRIFGKYRGKAREVVVSDPYQMVEDVWQLSFFTADKIGKALGVPADDLRRLRGALLTAVKHYAENGNLFATPEQAISYAAEISGVDVEKFQDAVDSLVSDGRLVSSRGGLYLPVYYNAERNGARRLLALASAPVKVDAELELPRFDIHGNEYSAKQREAMLMAVEHPVMVLTGGPGSEISKRVFRH